MLLLRWASNDSALCKDFIVIRVTTQIRRSDSNNSHQSIPRVSLTFPASSRINFLRMPSQLTRLNRSYADWLHASFRWNTEPSFFAASLQQTSCLVSLLSRGISQIAKKYLRRTFSHPLTYIVKKKKTEWRRHGRIASYLWISRLQRFPLTIPPITDDRSFLTGNSRNKLVGLFFSYITCKPSIDRGALYEMRQRGPPIQRYQLLDSKSLSIVKKLLSREKWVAQRRFARTGRETWYTRRVLFRPNEDLFATAM